MRISQDLNLNATLPADREGPLTFDGSGTLVLTRNRAAVTISPWLRNFRFQFWQFQSLPAASRIGRFLQALPAVWRFCK